MGTTFDSIMISNILRTSVSFFFSGFQISFRLWGIVMSLLQDDDVGVQAASCHCIQQAIKALPNHVSISGKNTIVPTATIKKYMGKVERQEPTN